jgi:hypothetical protein
LPLSRGKRRLNWWTRRRIKFDSLILTVRPPLSYNTDMQDSYPEKPLVPYDRTTVEMPEVVAYLQGADVKTEAKKAAYAVFRIESGNGKSGFNNNYVGAQADSGRWPAKFDPLITGVVEETENGTGRDRLFLAFGSWTSCVDFLLDRVLSRGLYVGGHATPISNMNVATETDLCTAYVREWAQGSATAKPTSADFETWESMYRQATELFT